jgi:pyruvate dehydrogenase E2 component (dihydrolipoamide acetyltransferase)
VLAAAGVTETVPGRSLAAPATADFEIQEPTRIQQVAARRLAEAKATIPDFQVETEVVTDRMLALRANLSDLGDERPTPSINDFVIKACAVALRRHPRVNASYVSSQCRLHRRVNLGVAVAAEDALIVPTLFDADTKSLGAIARESRRLAARVRAGEISPSELSGGTFTVSNLGMFGMTAIRPVINLPQAAILGVGVVRDTLVRVDGELVDRRLMTLTLSADHRILSGADAARFLADVKELLESPVTLLL